MNLSNPHPPHQQPSEAMITPTIDWRIPTAVAVSGGMDSMSLLHALSLRAQGLGVRLYAFYIHHDLQTLADDWQELVREFCEQLGVKFDTQRLDASSRAPAQSIEEWARIGRYQALAQLAAKHNVHQVVLAQHQDDQIETHLLQKKRGAGARGQAAMPASVERDGLRWVRPWLGVTRAQIHSYAQLRHIPYAHDPSNDNQRFARNAIREQLQSQPLSESEQATILHEIHTAQVQLNEQSEWAQSQLSVHHVNHREDIGESGRLLAWTNEAYTLAQQELLIREWFAQMGWRMPSRAALAELLKQLHSTRVDANMCWRHTDGWGVTRLKTHWIAARILPDGQWFISAELAQHMQARGWEIRARTGGERFRLALNRPHISLRHAYQMAGIAHMLRAQLPLFYCDGQLVHVTGVGDVFA